MSTVDAGPQGATTDVFEAMSTCRAMRYLKPDPVDDALIEQIITAATWAPSPGNSQGRDFIVVKDAAKKERIGSAIEAVMADRVAAMERPDRTHRLMLDGTAHLIATLTSWALAASCTTLTNSPIETGFSR